jgi:thymidine kinase
MIGKFNLILGSMRSSKSSYLFNQIDKAKFRKKRVVLIRPSIDTREFVSRTSNIDVDILVSDDLESIFEQLKVFDIICIDECQFLKNLGPVAHRLALQGKEVWAAGLNGDSDLHPWLEISNAIPYVDTISRLTAVCEECHSDNATFTFYEGKKSKIEIGEDKYRAYCRSCYEKASNDL